MTFFRPENQVSRVFRGRGLSPGVGCGTAYRIETKFPAFFRIRVSAEEVPAELDRFARAIAQAREQYLADKEKFEEVMGKDHSYIIDAHILMLEDQQLLGAVEDRIRNQHESAERSLRFVADRYLNAYRSLEDQYFKDRGFDFDEVIERILAVLLELDPEKEHEVSEDLILVGSEIGLSQLARFPLERLKGVVLSRAGQNSHVVIVARSLRIPVVSGIGNVRELVGTGDFVMVDGGEGTVEVSAPHDPAQAPGRFIGKQPEGSAVAWDLEPCYTADGVRIWIYANTEFGTEVGPAFDYGAEGIGLFRTEFIHLSRRPGLTEEERHYLSYRELVERLKGRPGVIRTLDVAEVSGAGASAGEEMAALGVRGIRLSLRKPDLFKRQVRAILRARTNLNLRLVLPMLTSVDELLEARALIHEVEEELGLSGAEAVSVGVLIEVPAAVLILEDLVPLSDFVAVGTNDLIQYTLAASRVSEEAAYLYNPFHPAVLQSMRRIVKVGEAHSVPVMVCGEMAAHPIGAIALAGLGFRQLSVAAPAIPVIKRILRQAGSARMKEWTEVLLEKRSLAEVSRMVAEAVASEDLWGVVAPRQV